MHKLLRLQALRAIAASTVVAAHGIGICASLHIIPGNLDAVDWAMGHLGVDIFFVISGFIMVRTAQDKFGSIEGAARFAWDRVTRVVPMYYIALVITALLVIRHVQIPPISIAQSFAFIPYWTPSLGLMRPILPLGWTLNYEMFFYLLFAVVVPLKKPMAVAALIAVLVGLVAIGSRFHSLLPYMEPRTPAQFWTDPILLFFGVGALIGYFEGRLSPLMRAPSPLALISGVMIATLAVSLIMNISYPMPLVWQLFFLVASVICVLLCVMPKDMKPSPLTEFLIARGDDSYCTYLFQFLAFAVLTPFLGRAGNRLWVAPIVVLSSLALANFFGWIANKYIARPLTRALRFRRKDDVQVVPLTN